jgi:hypothetical protein
MRVSVIGEARDEFLVDDIGPYKTVKKAILRAALDTETSASGWPKREIVREYKEGVERE